MTQNTHLFPVHSASGRLAMLAFLGTQFLPTHLSAQDACDEYEQQLITAFAQCLMQVASGGLCEQLEELGMRLQSELSPGCQATLAQSQQPPPTSGYPSDLVPPPSVYDHGGGTYSVPGLGACGEGGCIPFD